MTGADRPAFVAAVRPSAMDGKKMTALIMTSKAAGKAQPRPQAAKPTA